MNFLTALQADRLIERIREEPDPSSVNGKKLFAKLGSLGTGVIPKILEALASAVMRLNPDAVRIARELSEAVLAHLTTDGYIPDSNDKDET